MSFKPAAIEKCVVCAQTVYAMEKMAADGLVFHKNCMKCAECNKTLGLGNYAALSGKYYCKPHFKQLFALKGNYSEGFGEEKPTAKWQAKESDSPQPVRASPASREEPAADVVRSGSSREDASAIVAGGSQPPSDARKRFQELASPATPEAAGSPGATRKGGASPFAVRREVCHVCEKTVYEMEKMAADGLVFHKNCMKCAECNKTLGLGNYAALSGKYYCKPHFKQLFALKGNYSEGFGEEKPTAKWQAKAGGAEQAAPGAEATEQAPVDDEPAAAAVEDEPAAVDEPTEDEPEAGDE